MTASAVFDAWVDNSLDDLDVALERERPGAEAALDMFTKGLLAVPREDVEVAADQLIADVQRRLQAITSPVQRAVIAQALSKAIDARLRRERSLRDEALTVMLMPWLAMTKAFESETERFALWAKKLKDRREFLDNAHKAGQLSDAQYEALLADWQKDKDTYQGYKDPYNRRVNKVRKEQPWSPQTASDHAMISRGLWHSRIAPRIPFPVPVMSMADAERIAAESGRIVKYIEPHVQADAKARKKASARGEPLPPVRLTLRDAVAEVRNGAIDIMLAPVRDGGLGVANNVVSALMDFSTARTAQLRRPSAA